MTSDSVTLCDMDCDLSSSGWLTYGALEMCNSNDWWFVSQYLFVIIWLLARHKLAIENWQIAGTVLLCMLLLYWVVLSFMCDVGWVALITEGGHDETEQVPLQAKSLKCDEYVSLVFLLNIIVINSNSVIISWQSFIMLYLDLQHTQSLSLFFPIWTAIFQMYGTWVSRYHSVSILHFIWAKDHGDDGDNWSCKTCKAPVKSSPPTNQHPDFLQAGYPSCHPINSVT